MSRIIDLLQWPQLHTQGAERTTNGIVLHEIFGHVRLEDIRITQGWHRLEVEGGALLVELRRASDFKIVELAADKDSAIIVRLEEGPYEVRLFPGVRPGRYPFEKIALHRMNTSSLVKRFGSRLFKALSNPASWRRALRSARQIVFTKQPVGINADRRSTSDALGVLTRQDQMNAFSAGSEITYAVDSPTIWVRHEDGPISEEHVDRLGLRGQTYQKYVLDGTKPSDVSLVIPHDCRLTPDALHLIAKAFDADPDATHIATEVWIGERPTVRAAFDPFVDFERHPSLPYARRLSRLDSASVGWAQHISRHRIISAPVAVVGASVQIDSRYGNFSSDPRERSLVSIVIPTRDAAGLLATCLGGLFDKTDWPHEVIVIDNGSVEPETFALLRSFESKGLRVIRHDRGFNFSELCNLGAGAARGDFLCFVNNDIELNEANWLARLVALCQMSDVGAVGARLLYPDGTLQHGGVMLGMSELAGHLWRGADQSEQNRVPQLRQTSLRSAVSGALLCVDKKKFEAVGGFDAKAFPVTMNDIDLCLKLNARGWMSVYCAEVSAIHHEGVSRGSDVSPLNRARRVAELRAFHDRWAEKIASDPWLPPCALRSSERFQFK